MKKMLLTMLALLMLSIPALANGSGGLVAVKIEDGVYLSWNAQAGVNSYTLYRDGEKLVETSLTNYIDTEAGTSYSLEGLAPVSVWNDRYLEIPLTTPQANEVDTDDIKNCVIGPEMSIGASWNIYDSGSGVCVLINDEGKVMDVNAQATTAGGKVGVYTSNNGDNQKFYIEESGGGYIIRGKQSNLYLNADADGAVTIQDKAQATVFTVNYTGQKPSEAAINTATAIGGGGITYNANDASVGDLDGDGEYEIVLKWDPSDSKDASNNGKTGKVYIDAYKLDGTRLWRIDLGRNIRAGAHDTQFLVYDMDGDGKAEVAFRTADGTVDGTGRVIGDPDAVWTDNGTGKNLEGPLWVTVFDGATGAELASTPFDPQSNEPSIAIFGDDYGNRSERYNACVAYLDGENPYMVFQRGYYSGKAEIGPGRTVIAAYSYKNGEIKKYWRFDTMDEGNEKYIGQGNHNISVGDCDGDGKDEIFTGALTLDDNGSVLWCSFMGHGDAMHLGDFDPDHDGLEFFAVHEGQTAAQNYGFTVFDAKTGDILHAREAGKDTGRGLIANVGNFGGRYVAWAGSGAGKINSLGENLDLDFNSMNFRIYWDGDMYDELLDGTCIYKINAQGQQEVLINSADDGCASNNSTKSNPCLQADILGDWREEVIWRTADNTALRIYTTTIPTSYVVMPLMTDHIYRMGIVWQNSSYNQPPHLSYYLEEKTELTLNSASAKVNSRDVSLDVAPYAENGRTLVPLRFISESLGAKVDYQDGIISVTTDDRTVIMNIGSTDYTVNGDTFAMETVPVVINQRTLVPLRVVAEALGFEVDWDGQNQKVTVKRGEKGTMPEPIDNAPKAPVRIFIAGDSTAQSYRDNMAPQAGWGQELSLFFDDSVTVENRAIAGRSLKSFFNEGRWTSILEDAQPGDYVIIQFGHNDGAWNKPERYISHEDFAVMLEDEYIKPALDKGLIPIIATQTQGHWFDQTTGLIEEPGDEVSYASLLRDAAEKYNLTLIDVNKLSRELENKMGEETSRRLHLYANPGEYENYPDGVQDNTHFSYYGAFEIAKIVAEGLEEVSDLEPRRTDGYSIIGQVQDQRVFDVRQYQAFADEFTVAIKYDAPGNVTINGRTVMTENVLDAQLVTRTSADQDGRITVTASVPVIAEVAPIWSFAPEGGIDTAAREYFMDIPDGAYDFEFIKSDNNRGNIYVNSLLIGANVDMYGTVNVPQGTVYSFNGFEVQGGASVKVDQKTTRLLSVKAAKTPSIFPRKARIYVAGDSTLCNYYPILPDRPEADIQSGTVRTGWAQLLDRFVSDKYEVVNLASSGDWARDWKDCIFPTVAAQGKAGDILVIQFGINDRNRDDKTKDTMKDALKYMIEQCSAKGITPILVKPQPSVGYSWGSAGDFEKPNGNNGGFFTAVTEVADETGCAYVDLYDLAAEHFAQVGRDYVSRSYQLWDSNTDTMADKLHISFAGAKKLCQLFSEDANAQGLINTREYLELTKVIDGVYVLENSTDAELINSSDAGKTITLSYDGATQAVTLAGHCKITVKKPVEIAL